MDSLYQAKRGLYKKEYCAAKSRATVLYERGKLERALREIEYAASIAWHKPILEAFVDEELEALIEKCVDELIPPVHLSSLTREGARKRAVLYSGQIIDTGALTEQYLNYLIEHDYEVLFVVQDKEYAINGRGILKRTSGLGNVRTLILESRSRLGKIKELYRAILEFDPDFSFLHFLPNDVVGYAAFSMISGRPRYYVVHNDHTFWLGKGCSDFFLEFRQMGVRTAIDLRGIDATKVINLPYYPIRSGVPFQGFPFDPEDKVVGLSGAQLSKYFRDPDLRYFQSIKNLLDIHKDFVFCLCGAGTVAQIGWINQFINENGFNDRFFYLGKRPDFYELVGQVDILFESYPQRGGLVVLFGTNQGKAIVGIGSSHPYPGTTSQYLDVKAYEQPLSFETFESEASRLIRSKEYRASNAQMFAQTQYNRVDFDAKLREIISQGFRFKDPLIFYRKVVTPTLSSYDCLLRAEQGVSEFLWRSKVRAYIESEYMRRVFAVVITLRFNGVQTLIRRILKKLRKSRMRTPV